MRTRNVLVTEHQLAREIDAERVAFEAGREHIEENGYLALDDLTVPLGTSVGVLP